MFSLKKVLLFFFTIASTTWVWSQNNLLQIETAIPAQPTICSDQNIIRVTVSNPTPLQIHSITAEIALPTDIYYSGGSIVGATELNLSPQLLIFNLPNIAAYSKTEFSFKIQANCNVQNAKEIAITIKYTTNSGFNGYDIAKKTIPPFKQPYLAITQITNQTYTGVIGTTYQKSITITNVGSGKLSAFSIEMRHGSGINILSANIGTIQQNDTLVLFTISSNDFTSVGNNDGYLDSGEQIILTETDSILNCRSVLSEYVVYWGCLEERCQSLNFATNVSFNNVVPLLEVTPTNSYNICLGEGIPNQQSLLIVNKGNGVAKNINMAVFMSTLSYPSNNTISKIDTSTIKYRVNSQPIANLSVDSIFHCSTTIYCLDENADACGIYLSFEELAPNDSLYIQWEIINCCADTLNKSNLRSFAGWRYEGKYQNDCGKTFLIPNSQGRNHTSIIIGLINVSNELTFSDGDVKTLSYFFSVYGNSMPSDATRRFIYEVHLPPCLEYVGNFKMIRANGTTVLNASSVQIIGDKIIAKFTLPWTFLEATVKFDVRANCSLPGCSQNINEISLYSFLNTSTTCSCNIALDKTSNYINVLCEPSNVGYIGTNNKILRVNYGLPDNNNDGIADPSPATIDLNKIARDRAMIGDTLNNKYFGVIKTSGLHPSWEFLGLNDSISHGAYISFLSGFVKIVSVAFGNTYYLPLNNPDTSNIGTIANFNYLLNINDYINFGLLPMGFQLLQNDSIIFDINYKISKYFGSNLQECVFLSTGFVSANLEDFQNGHKYFSNPQQGRITFIGYVFGRQLNIRSNATSCNNITTSFQYVFGIGPSKDNWAGGNLFPWEYRNWSYIKGFKVAMPPNFEFVSARFRYSRTGGTLVIVTSSWMDINPVQIDGDTLYFDVTNLFDKFGGSLIMPDDGFHGNFDITYKPSCAVPSRTLLPINYSFLYKAYNFLGSPDSLIVFNTDTTNFVYYDKPDIFIQSELPVVLPSKNQAIWQVSLSNPSNFDVPYTWLYLKQFNHLQIDSLINVATNTKINPDNGFYQLDTLYRNTEKTFRIYAQLLDCSIDSLIVYSGWGCGPNYPSSIETVGCPTQQILLKSIPQYPYISAEFTQEPSNTNLCEPFEYEVLIKNLNVGNAFIPKIQLTIPEGIYIIPGTSQLKYPTSNAYTIISDPTPISSELWEWNLSGSFPNFASSGLPNVLERPNNELYLKFQVEANCDFISGNNIQLKLLTQSGCDSVLLFNLPNTSNVYINTIEDSYSATIKPNIPIITPCGNYKEMTISFINNGSGATGTHDSIFVILPPNVNYVLYSCQPIYNSLPNLDPVVENNNNKTILKWLLPSNLIAGDSVTFSIQVHATVDSVRCGLQKIIFKSLANHTAFCISGGSNCDIEKITALDSINVYAYTAFLEIENATAVLSPLSNNESNLSLALLINNLGADFLADTNLIISIYNDIDNDSLITSSDVLLFKDSVFCSLYSGDSKQVLLNKIISASAICNLIIHISTAENACVCNEVSYFIPTQFNLAGFDTTICAGTNIQLGKPPISGFDYQWNTIAFLNDSLIANPTFSSNPAQLSTEVFQYIVTATNGFCLKNDSVKITVHPIPQPPLLSPDAYYCQFETITPLEALGDNIVWYNDVGLTNPVGVGNNYSPYNLTNVNGIYSFYATQTINNCTSDASSVQIVVYEKPTKPDIIGQTIYCTGESIQPLIANGSNIVWYADSLLTSIISTENSYVPSFSTSNPDTFYLWVTQHNTHCESEASKTEIIVYATPQPPIVADSIFYCVEELVLPINATGNSIVWFNDSNLSDTIALGNSFTPAINNTSSGIYEYWVIQNNEFCSSNPAHTVLQVNERPALPLVDSLTNLCRINEIQTIYADGQNIHWYADPLLNNLLQIGSDLSENYFSASNDTLFYWVTQNNGICESYAKPVQVLLHAIPSKPLVQNNIEYCAGDIIHPIIATGENIYWYSDSLLQNFICQNDTLQINYESISVGTHYFYTVNNNGFCNSEKEKITLTVHQKPLKPFNDTILQACFPTIMNLNNFSNSSYYWYADSLLNNFLGSGNAYAPYIPNNLSHDTIFYLVNKIGTCQSEKTSLKIHPKWTNNPIVSFDSLSICAYDTLTYLIANGDEIQWYADNLLTNLLTISDTLFINYSSTIASDTSFYVVNYKDGCKSETQEIKIHVKEKPAAPIVDNSVHYCVGDIVLPLTASGNNINWFADSLLTLWLYAGNNYNTGITSNSPNQYTFYATQTVDGCISNLSKTVVEILANPNPPVLSDTLIHACMGDSIPKVLVIGNDISCYKDSLLQQIYATGNIIDFGVATTNSIYWVIQQINQCISKPAKIEIIVYQKPNSPPSLNDVVLCAGSHLDTITISGNNIYWFADSMLTMLLHIGNSYLPNINTQNPQTLILWIASYDNGCYSLPVKQKIIIKPKPSTPAILANNPVCVGETINISTPTSAVDSYQWILPDGTTSNEQMFTITPASLENTGWYQLYVIQNSCSSDTSRLFFNVFPIPPAPLLGGNAPVCLTKSLLLTSYSTATSTYHWFGPNNFVFTGKDIIRNNVSFSMKGKYFCYVVDNGCISDTSNIYVDVFDNPKPYLGPDKRLCPNQPAIEITPGKYYQYLWSTGETTASIFVNQPDIYWVKVADINGCEGSDTIQILEICPSVIFVPNSFTPNDDGLNDELKVYADGIQDYKMQIFNRWGELIFESRDYLETWNGKYKGKIVPSGYYAYQITYKGYSIDLKWEEQTLTGTIHVLR